MLSPHPQEWTSFAVDVELWVSPLGGELTTCLEQDHSSVTAEGTGRGSLGPEEWSRRLRKVESLGHSSAQREPSRAGRPGSPGHRAEVPAVLSAGLLGTVQQIIVSPSRSGHSLPLSSSHCLVLLLTLKCRSRLAEAEPATGSPVGILCVAGVVAGKQTYSRAPDGLARVWGSLDFPLK